MALEYDPDFLDVIRPHLRKIQNSWTWKPLDVTAIRTNMPALLGSFSKAEPVCDTVKVEEHIINTFDGAEITVFHFFSKDADQTSPTSAVLHMHGGGMVMGSVYYQKSMLAEYVEKTRTQIFSVEYRLAPEQCGLSLVEDCYSALKWLHTKTDVLNVDPSRIAVMGESAGGGLAAGVALLARERHLSPVLAKQILLAPMLDDRNVEGGESFESLALWRAMDNLTGWTAVLGEDRGKDNVPAPIAPARVVSTQGLPKTYIDVGGLDIFRNEAITYSQRLMQSDIETEFHIYPGLPHGFELFGSKHDIISRVLQNRYNAIRKI